MYYNYDFINFIIIYLLNLYFKIWIHGHTQTWKFNVAHYSFEYKKKILKKCVTCLKKNMDFNEADPVLVKYSIINSFYYALYMYNIMHIILYVHVTCMIKGW